MSQIWVLVQPTKDEGKRLDNCKHGMVAAIREKASNSILRHPLSIWGPRLAAVLAYSGLLFAWNLEWAEKLCDKYELEGGQCSTMTASGTAAIATLGLCFICRNASKLFAMIPHFFAERALKNFAPTEAQNARCMRKEADLKPEVNDPDLSIEAPKPLLDADKKAAHLTFEELF